MVVYRSSGCHLGY
uniref:Uncharacterized protein n=1 Tax=Fusarium oxysporum (strain Fo5176) TaxID=660025 RepID=A0A0D2YKT0_FUSOF